jgi:hypothetical protein
LSGKTFDLPNILSSGRFLLPHKMSGDEMHMSGSNPYENNFCPQIDYEVNIVQNDVYFIFRTNQISLKTASNITRVLFEKY